MIRGSAGGIGRPPARVEGPCRAAESASSAPHRQDSARVALRPPSRRVEPVRGTRVGTRPRTERRLEIDPPRRRGGAWQAWSVLLAAWTQRVPGVGTERLRDAWGSAGVSGDRLVAWRGLAAPLRALVPRCTDKISARVALRPPSRRVEPVQGTRVGTRPRAERRLGIDPPPRRVKPSQRVGSRLLQSRPNPRGGSTLSSSPRSSAQIASSLSASAVSWSASGRLSSHS